LVLGIPIDELNMEQTLDRLESFFHIGGRSGKFQQVATVNADFVVKALQDPELRYLLQGADLATADGIPLVWGARLLGVPLEERVAGSDLVPALIGRAAEKGYSIYLLGAGPGVAARAADVLKERYPELIIAGIQSPPFSPVLEMSPAIVDEINAAQPDILLVAFGNPKQEKWIDMTRTSLRVPVVIGVGATLDFIAGSKKRAPLWMQRLGLEWSYRLLQEPARLWRRYVVDIVVFTTFFLRQWWIMRQAEAPSVLLPDADLLFLNDNSIINVQGRLTLADCGNLLDLGQQGLALSNKMIVNLERAEFLDSATIGVLVNLTKMAREQGGELTLVATPAPIRNSLKMLRLETFFAFQDSLGQALQIPIIESNHELDSLKVVAEISPSRTKWQVIKAPRYLDHLTTPEMNAAWAPRLEYAPYVVLDLSETVVITSAGLALLAKLHRLAAEANGELRLSGCSKDVGLVIEMVRFDELFPIYPNLAAATS
jgi:N-acetylglucosaminyldiphosphoundecaprenol N-acetyl-beta-D-mannosaminyltransferase